METTSNKKFLVLAGVFCVLAILSLLYALEGFTSYQTNKEIWEGNMQAYEEYEAAGNTVEAEQQMGFALDMFDRMNERKTQMTVGGIGFLVSLAISGFAFKKRHN